jgi:hypothetical protein
MDQSKTQKYFLQQKYSGKRDGPFSNATGKTQQGKKPQGGKNPCW